MADDSSSEGAPIRILLLEDLANDVTIIERQIRKAGLNYTLKNVKAKSDFIRALFNFKPHLIIADYYIPGFDGTEALMFVQQNTPSTPFIFVTGTLNDEELAAQTILGGASEFVLKHNIRRLPEVIQSVLAKTSAEWVKRAEIEQKLLQYKISIEQYQKEIDQYKSELEKFQNSADDWAEGSL
ncbi:MAG: response regulator [Anaerolineae bacterium]|nr:response regulator [Anaerolineae bacterium]